MTPAEIAALRERLANTPQHYSVHGNLTIVPSADIRAALALLDAQAAEIARLTAELERAWADGIEDAARVCDRLVSDAKSTGYPVHQGCFYEASRHIRALAPAPAADVAG